MTATAQACHAIGAVRTRYVRPIVNGDDVALVLDDVAAAVASALASLDEWGLAGTRPGQYRSDLAADAAALAVLDAAGFGAFSEESGLHDIDRDVVVVLDPLDGSTNASRGIPWFATSLCALDADGPLAALVVNLATGTRYHAVRGSGAWRDGVVIRPSTCTAVGDAIVALSGYPPRPYGWRQYRALGASALDLCAVADGTFDAFVDCSDDAHGPWDYLGAALVLREAGGVMTDLHERELTVVDWSARRTPIAAGTHELHAVLHDLRAGA
jgi:fructose-1,6-bisphosphatase/inositol monophosphatase family enzyme